MNSTPSEGSLGGFVTAQERQQLPDLLEKAIRGDELAITGVCEFIEMRMKQETINRISRVGAGSSVDDAYQQALLTVQSKLSRLKVVDAFESWFWRVVKSTAKQFRPRYVQYGRTIQVNPEISNPLSEVGSKTILISSKPQIVRIFEPLVPHAQLIRRRRFLEPITDEILVKASISNRSNYPRKIDVWSATAQLPKRWAKALLLMCVEERSAAEVAGMMGCSVERVYKLVQKAKHRMRELLPGYPEGQPTTVRAVQTKQKNPTSDIYQPHRSRPVTRFGKVEVARPSRGEAFPP
jgi:RNA polymerase sigma factor (sigma-70 family)